MLSAECERKLCNILKKLSFGERSVEIQRIIISEDTSFSPHSAFQVLDSLQFNQLMPRSFIDFLPQNSPLTEKQLYLLIKQYSSRSNGRLSIDDFLNFVLPSTQFSLRELAVKRRVFPSDELSYSQAFAIARLIEKEVELQNQLEELKQDLYSASGFSFWNAFKTLDETGTGVVQEEDLMRFARKLGEYFSCDDIDAILRRIDTNDDMALDYNEFLEFLLPVYAQKKEESQQEKKSEDPEKKQQENPEESSPQISELQSFQTPVKAQEQASSEKPKKKLEVQELEVAKTLLRTEVKFERMIEFMRENLSILTNFSILQALEYFDVKQKGKADIEDLTDRLIELQVEFSRDELLGIVKRWGNEEAQMGFEQFSRLFTPRNQTYSQALDNRESEKFNEETLEQLGGFFSALIDYERSFESLQEASNLPDEPISESELGQALLKVGLDVPEQDMKLLHERYSSPIR